MILLLLLAALTAVGLAAGVASTRPDPEPVPERLAAATRSPVRWRWAGVVLGGAVAAATLQVGALGRGMLLAAPAFALCVLAGVVTGELRVSAPRGAVRQAGLVVRRWQDYVPARLFPTVMAAAAILALLMAFTYGLGGPDDMGRAGRWLVQRCSDSWTQAKGPWPGSFYVLPLAAVLAGGLLLAGIALTGIARRPSQGEDADVEDALRRRSAAAVTAATGLLVAVPLAGVSLLAAIAMLGIDCRPAWWTALGWALVALVPATVALAVWCVVVLTAPSTVARETTPVATGR